MSDTKKYRYRVVDVFTTRQLEGNPLAVFPEASGIADATMQKIARELNLSETVFIFPATSDRFAARLRIFTPGRELPFAGHPTVGASFVLLDERAASLPAGGFVLEEKIGPVPVRVEASDPPKLWLTTPPIQDGPTFEGAACAATLGLSPSLILDARPQILNAGNPTLFVAVRDKAAVDAARTNAEAMQALRGAADSDPICLFVFTPTPEGAYSRLFAPEYGIIEDPATGSSTGPLALFMMRNRLVSSTSGTQLVSEQGTKMGRRSLLYVNIKGDMGRDGIEVGGNVVPVAEATMTLESGL